MLESRKVFFSGKSSYILTLPKKWVKENGIEAGNEVIMSIGKNFITIYPKKADLKKKLVSIDSKDLRHETLMRRIISYYLAGMDSIRLTVYNEEQRSAISRATDILIGAEVVEDTGKEIVMEIFLDNSRLKTENIMRRMGNTCVGMVSDFCTALKKFDRYICNSIIAREREVDRLHFLLLRQLKLANMHADVASELEIPVEKIQEYRTVVRSLERVADHAANMAESLLELGKPVEYLCELVDADLEMLRTAVVAFLENEIELAEVVLEEFDEFEELEKRFYSRVLSADVEEALYLKSIIDSISRIASYSADIAEVVVDMAVV
ncbi:MULTISPECIES: phosphate signaling complex PhoU family protein [unclassified Archaeoglobus]|jgi:phosphate uptake regulator|uniref:phosphate signaling complex PhoU family protein n=1 Tax=unclassified Archaeoglobus TaxID=2643606 RepID=UPI0025BBF666|nr:MULTISPECIES: phosphate uptake regulator PhoU [unclassified Archaeoglobus]